MNTFLLVFILQASIYNLVNSYKSSHHNHHGHTSHKRYHPLKTKVIMPSGETHLVILPTGSTKRCDDRRAFKAKRITLNSYSRTWKKEYTQVKAEMENKKGVQSDVNFQIIKIQKILNSCLWKKYQYRKDQVKVAAKVSNERMLFQAPRAPNVIVDKGFDERYANGDLDFGAGLYFADNALRTHAYTKVKSDGTRTMLLCRVTLGIIHNVTTTPAKFAHPPVGFHSTSGENGGFREYVVYRGEQAYPEYLITYKV